MNNFYNKFQPTGRVKVITGSILAPESTGLGLVLSVNNLAGKADNPLVPLFEKKWQRVKQDMKGWYATRTGEYKFGAINTTACQSDVWVIHCLCQDEHLNTNLDGLKECLKKVTAIAKDQRATVHISNLLVDSIPELKDIAVEQFTKNGINVTFYNER